jgi:endonuclease/exonuclease/phosphatase family metal-dependent hydrolase
MNVAAPKRKRSARGPLTVLAMFALGGAVLCGLYLAPRGASPRSPGVPWGAPARTLRFVSFDCGGRSFEQVRDAIDAIRGRDADFVMLQQMPAGDVLSFVERLGLQQNYYTNLFQRTGPGGRDETGCVVLSKHPLYDARPLRPGGRRGACLGTWTVAAVDGVRFAVVSAHTDARADPRGGREAVAGVWREAGSPPVVLGFAPAADRSAPAGWALADAAGTVLTDPRWHIVGGAGASGTGGGVDGVDLSGAPPRQVVVGAPDRPLRFVAYNIYHDYRGIEGTTGQVRKLDPPPDFVLLAEIEPQNVRRWAGALKLPHTCYPPVGRQPDGSPVWPDTAIFSRHPLSDGRPLQTPDGRTFGLWAMATVDGNKFAVAAVHLWPTFGIDPRHVAFTGRMRNDQLKILIDTWQNAGSPPLVVGGDFNQPAVGENYGLMTKHFTDALKSIGRDSGTFRLGLAELRIDYVLATPDWRAAAGGVEKGDASDHWLVWANLGPAPKPASQPTGR